MDDWPGGKSLERRAEVFVSAAKTEVVFQAERRRLSLHCGRAASSLRQLLRNDRGALSQHIWYSHVQVTCAPVCMAFCISGSVNVVTWNYWTRQMFNFLLNRHKGEQVMAVSHPVCCLCTEQAECSHTRVPMVPCDRGHLRLYRDTSVWFWWCCCHVHH